MELLFYFTSSYYLQKMISLSSIQFRNHHDIDEILLKVALNTINYKLLLNSEKFECTKGVVRNRKLTKYNGEMTNDKMTNNDLQNTTQKTKDRKIQTPLKTVGQLMCSGRKV
jgi:hypothetical protein